MEQDDKRQPGIHEGSGKTFTTPGETRKKVGVYERPTKALFSKSIVWILLLVILIALAVIFLF